MLLTHLHLFDFFYQAGIGSPNNPEQLLIALEPEAAAVLCMERKLHDPASKQEIESVEKPLSVPLLQYMVVDIGGK